MGDAGAKSIMDGLLMNNTLKELHLSGNNISEKQKWVMTKTVRKEFKLYI